MSVVSISPSGWRRLNPLAWIRAKLEQRRQNLLIMEALKNYWSTGEIKTRLDKKYPIFDLLCKRRQP